MKARRDHRKAGKLREGNSSQLSLRQTLQSSGDMEVVCIVASAGTNNRSFGNRQTCQTENRKSHRLINTSWNYRKFQLVSNSMSAKVFSN